MSETDTTATETAAAPEAVGDNANIIQKAIAEADRIVKDAEAKAKTILDDAAEEVKEALANTRTFIHSTHDDIAHPLQFICAEKSKVGDALDMLLGNAVSCYCCAAVRMGLIGFLSGAAVAGLVALGITLL